MLLIVSELREAYTRTALSIHSSISLQVFLASLIIHPCPDSIGSRSSHDIYLPVHIVFQSAKEGFVVVFLCTV